VSENLDLVRSIYADWERGVFGRTDWGDPAIEFVVPDGPEPGSWTGVAAMAVATRDYLLAWEGFRWVADEYRELDAERVLVLASRAGRGRRSGLEVEQIATQGASLFQLRDGKVTRLAHYWDRDHALADLGLEE